MITVYLYLHLFCLVIIAWLFLGAFLFLICSSVSAFICSFATEITSKRGGTMPRVKKPAKVKELIRLRMKDLANGNKSLYLGTVAK